MGTARVGVGGGRGGGECGPIEVLSAECEYLSLSMDLDEKAELPQLKHAEEGTSRAIDTDTHWAHRPSSPRFTHATTCDLPPAVQPHSPALAIRVQRDAAQAAVDGGRVHSRRVDRR